MRAIRSSTLSEALHCLSQHHSISLVRTALLHLVHAILTHAVRAIHFAVVTVAWETEYFPSLSGIYCSEEEPVSSSKPIFISSCWFAPLIHETFTSYRTVFWYGAQSILFLFTRSALFNNLSVFLPPFPTPPPLHNSSTSSTSSSTITMKILSSFVALTLIHQALGHGYMNVPPMRGSMWRYPSEYPSMKEPTNSQDNALRAGGPFYVRAGETPPPYGMCGDSHSDPAPRAHESGGTFGRFPTLGADAVSKCYRPGQEVEFELVIDANHGGHNQFQLCVPGVGNDETEECFEQYLLERSDGKGTNTSFDWAGGGVFKMKYNLPGGVICEGEERCVLRWYWLTSNAPMYGSANLLEVCFKHSFRFSVLHLGPSFNSLTFSLFLHFFWFYFPILFWVGILELRGHPNQ